MIKNLIASLAALVAVSTPAWAGDFYGTVRAGIVMNAEAGPIELSDGDTYGVALGTAVGPVRVEVAANHSNFDVFPGVTADFNTVSATANIDFQITPQSTVYVGAGPAWGEAEASFGFGSYSDSGIGYVIQAGYSRRLSDTIVGELQVRRTDVDLDDSFDVSGYGVTAGLRFRL